MPKIKMSYCKRCHIAGVLEVQKDYHAEPDPDFGVAIPDETYLTEARILQLLRDIHERQVCYVLHDESDQCKVFGYALYSPETGELHRLEVLNELGVETKTQYETFLLNEIERKVIEKTKNTQVFAIIPDNDDILIKILSKNGYKAVKMLKNYFSTGAYTRDAYKFEKKLAKSLKR